MSGSHAIPSLSPLLFWFFIPVLVPCRGALEAKADLRFQLRGYNYDILTGHFHLGGGLDKVKVIRNCFRDYSVETQIVEGL